MRIKLYFIIVHIVLSLFSICLNLIEKILNNPFIGYQIWGYIFLFNLLTCFTGIIVFVVLIVRRKLIISLRFLFLIPSLLLSLVFLYTATMLVFGNVYEGGMLIPTIIMGIGMPLLLYYYLLKKENLSNILITILCIIWPISIFISYIEMLGLLGI
jgi:hypothetical protein